jgi:hypothetical protein
MPVNSTHLEYDANAAVWLRARRVRPGSHPSHVTWLTSWTVKKHPILVKKRSSFGCSINHLRKLPGDPGQVFCWALDWSCRWQHPRRLFPFHDTAKPERGRLAACAHQTVRSKAVSKGFQNPCASASWSLGVNAFIESIRLRGALPEPTAFFFRSSLVIFGHVWSSSIPIPTWKSVRPNFFRTGLGPIPFSCHRFSCRLTSPTAPAVCGARPKGGDKPAKLDREKKGLFWSSFGQVLDALSTTYIERLTMPVKFPLVRWIQLPYRNPRRARKTGVKKGQRVPNRAKKCQTTTCKPAFTGLGRESSRAVLNFHPSSFPSSGASKPNLAIGNPQLVGRESSRAAD